jgi:hypothetical protein
MSTGSLSNKKKERYRSKTPPPGSQRKDKDHGLIKMKRHKSHASSQRSISGIRDKLKESIKMTDNC